MNFCSFVLDWTDIFGIVELVGNEVFFLTFWMEDWNEHLDFSRAHFWLFKFQVIAFCKMPFRKKYYYFFSEYMWQICNYYSKYKKNNLQLKNLSRRNITIWKWQQLFRRYPRKKLTYFFYNQKVKVLPINNNFATQLKEYVLNFFGSLKKLFWYRIITYLSAL